LSKLLINFEKYPESKGLSSSEGLCDVMKVNR